MADTDNPIPDTTELVSADRTKPVSGRCNAFRTKDSTYCRGRPHNPTNVKNQRCRHHGGMNTGPKTQAGRDAVAQNAVTHGLYQKLVRDSLPPEDKAVFDVVPQTTDLSTEIGLARVRLLRLQRIRQTGEFTNGKPVNFALDNGGQPTPEDAGSAPRTRGPTLDELEEKAIDLIRRLAGDQQHMHPGSAVSGRLTITVDLTESAEAASADVPDLTLEGQEDIPDTDGEAGASAEPAPMQTGNPNDAKNKLAEYNDE